MADAFFDQLGAANVKIRPSQGPPPGPDMALHAENRARLVAGMRGADVLRSSVVLLQGGEGECRHETGG